MIAIDFFCGGGGITRGLINAGINVLGGFDSCLDYKTTYETNNNCKFVGIDIRDVLKETIYLEFPAIKGCEDDLLLAGCAPCQPFSLQRRIKSEHTDVNLLTEFGRIVECVKPAHILVENVPGLKGKGETVFNAFLTTIKNCGYFFSYRIINAKYYGVPQNRKRLVLIASRFFKPSIPDGIYGNDKLPFNTIKDAISNYPPIKSGENYTDIPNHKAASLSELNMERIKSTPHSGGDRRSWPSHLILTCHKNGYKGHTDVYGRMDWETVSPTLTARCYSLSNGRYGHPEQNRAISLREAAAIQTFSDDYIFYGNTISIGKQIGNAVPVKLSEALGKYILYKSINMQIEND